MQIPRLRSIAVPLLLCLSVVGTEQNATAQNRIELGGSLISATFVTSGDTGAIVAVPAGGIGLMNPGVYASFPLGKRAALEPQFGLIWATSGGHSDHVLNVSMQFSYFIRDLKQRSPYVFAGGGVVEASGGGYTPKSFGAGAGYRIPLGDRLVVRIDGRYLRYTARYGNDLNLVAFTFSIGGLFGK